MIVVSEGLKLVIRSFNWKPLVYYKLHRDS